VTRAQRPQGQTRADLVAEAHALEQAGCVWQMKHAQAITGYSDSYIRNSSCPKERERLQGRGTKGRDRVVFDPAKVRAWQASLRTRAE
jgi:hypothetical protein